MGKPTGFLDFERQTNTEIEPLERIKNFNEFHVPISEDDRRTQAARCMECGVPFCQSGMMISGMASGCPLNNMCPEWNDLLYIGCYEQALGRLLKTNNFPEFTSRVCPAPCEAACTCGLNDTPVTIKENENAIIEYGYANGYMDAKPPKVRTGKKVAIIGSGPAGLAAADQLNKRGHNVTVFEREDHPGGLLMYGIPNMKLDKSVIERKIKIMEEEGVVFKTGVNVGVDIKAETLRKDYERVILACGASNPRDIKAPGREAVGIYFAVDYLKRVTKHLRNPEYTDYIDVKGKNVLVIGGGDTGNDCVGSSIRQGAKSVVQLEMMPKPPEKRADNNPWPEWPKVLKTDYGQQEAIAVFGCDPRIYETTVKEFIADKNGILKQVKGVKLAWTKDESGRMKMSEIPGSEYTMDIDYVFIAAGFLGTEEYITKDFGVKLTDRTNVLTEPGQYSTSESGVFTAGDMHRGQSLVVWAIREGREVAKAVDKDLMGYTNLN
jgi:glutamate synthase (NADPH/NADH) small chain